MLGSLLLTGINSDLSLPYYIGTSAAWLHVLWQIWTADLQNSPNLDARFRSNVYTGSLVFASLVAGKVIM
jgi:4-hydroxybenzoate polyprenyltransferase